MARILAVDDEPTIRRLVRAALEGRGHEVTEASGGMDAVAAAKTDPPDLVILDVMMPKMDGHAVRKKLRADERTKDVPIVFLSAVGEFEEQLHELEDGAAAYMTKPFSPRDLADTVDAILDPDKREILDRAQGQQKAKLTALTEIMRKKREEG